MQQAQVIKHFVTQSKFKSQRYFRTAADCLSPEKCRRRAEDRRSSPVQAASELGLIRSPLRQRTRGSS